MVLDRCKMSEYQKAIRHETRNLVFVPLTLKGSTYHRLEALAQSLNASTAGAVEQLLNMLSNDIEIARRAGRELPQQDPQLC